MVAPSSASGLGYLLVVAALQPRAPGRPAWWRRSSRLRSATSSAAAPPPASPLAPLAASPSLGAELDALLGAVGAAVAASRAAAALRGPATVLAAVYPPHVAAKLVAGADAARRGSMEESRSRRGGGGDGAGVSEATTPRGGRPVRSPCHSEYHESVTVVFADSACGHHITPTRVVISRKPL